MTSKVTDKQWKIGSGEGYFITWNGPIFVTTLASTDSVRDVATRGDARVRLRRGIVDDASGIVLMQLDDDVCHSETRHITYVTFAELACVGVDTEVLHQLLTPKEARRNRDHRKRQKAEQRAAMLLPVERSERELLHPELGVIEVSEHAAERMAEHLIMLRRVIPTQATNAEQFRNWKIRVGLKFIVIQLETAIEKQRKNSLRQAIKHQESGRYFIHEENRVVLVITAAGEEIHQVKTAYFKSNEELKSLYACRRTV